MLCIDRLASYGLFISYFYHCDNLAVGDEPGEEGPVHDRAGHERQQEPGCKFIDNVEMFYVRTVGANRTFVVPYGDSRRL